MRRVAITGLGAVTPVGNTAAESWQNLIAGQSGIGPLTAFDAADYKVKVAAQVKGFDPTLYMEKKEARHLDLYSQYALAAATQAMEDSALKDYDPERLGVYFGSGIGGIHALLDENRKLQASGPSRISPFLVPMMIGNTAAGNIAIRFHAQGPCLPVVTACATGSNAVGEAYRAIAHGYADYILAGGSEASIVDLAVAGFTSCMALTTNPDPATACTPFDARRSGFVIGEGAGALVLEEWEHAQSRGAHIYAELSGYGCTCDAHHITAPDPEAGGASRAIAQAAQPLCLAEDALLYINAHGTSTPLNDSSETLAIKKGLGEAAARRAMISSTKSMTGHMLGAAGAVEAVVCALALDQGVLPPTIGYAQPDPACDLDYIPNQARRVQPQAALSVSLGFGGHNACLAFKKAVKG